VNTLTQQPCGTGIQVSLSHPHRIMNVYQGQDTKNPPPPDHHVGLGVVLISELGDNPPASFTFFQK
jgi:hypothetical protein